MTATPALIRDLFLHPRPTYTPAAAAEAIGMSVEDVEGWMEVGELEGESTRDGVVLSWAELVSSPWASGSRRRSKRHSAPMWRR